MLVRFELDRDRVSETLVENILRIQDLEASTLASTRVIADGDRRDSGFDLDELLGAVDMDRARDRAIELDSEDGSLSMDDDAEPSPLTRFEKDR